jgi:carbon monoxide dehydrogenase subunit G
MKLVSRHDIEAPVDFVFQALSDFDYWERVAMRRGAEVVRADRPKLGGRPGTDPVWQVRFTLRGKDRKITLRVVEVTAPARLAFDGAGQMFDGQGAVDLIALGGKRTRLTMASDIKPKTIAARLIIQSLKLARRRVQARLDKRVGALAADIEGRWQDANRKLGRG